MSGLKTHTKLYSALPQYLLVIRGGVDQGQIPMVQTKEIAGIKRAVYKISHDKKNPLFKAWKLKAWKPKFIVVMYNKKASEKIYEYQHTEEGLRYLLPSRPCIVQQAITSQNIWDTLMYVGGGTRAHNKWKPSKVTILDFEIDQSEAANLYQLLHAMHYGYGYSVPFPMGPTALPGMRVCLILRSAHKYNIACVLVVIAPLLFAAHYSQWAKEMILKHDVSIDTLDPHRKLKKRPHHVDA